MDEKNAIENAKEYWNSIHQNLKDQELHYDDWLNPFTDIIDATALPIIDLGCGEGNNVMYLLEKRKKVIPCDYSEAALLNVQKRFPELKEVFCFDMTLGLPFENNSSDIVICDLSLHYFTEKTTLTILEEIKRILTPNGILLFRVNSTKDFNHGAGQGIEIEPHLYENNGSFKRFFDKQDFNKLFTDWETLYLKEETMSRYTQEKIVWRGAMKVAK